MEFSEGTQDKLLPALIAARKKIDPILKTKEAIVKTERGEYSYTYAGFGETVDLIMTALLENDLMLSFDADIIPGNATATGDEVGRKVKITGLLEHTSGQWRRQSLPFPYAKTSPTMNIYQAIGAIVTYGSRIIMFAMLGLASIDNDAQGVEGEGHGTGNGKKEEKAASGPAAQAQAPAAPAAPAQQGTKTLVAPECLDSYEAARQILEEKVNVGGKDIPLFLPDQVVAYTKKLGAAARDLSAMTLLYAEIMNASNTNRQKIEKTA